MQTRFTAIFIGGPPHSGKSTLAHRLSSVLHSQGISHYLLRANPDGEGNWYYEANDTIIHYLRRNNKKGWSQNFTHFIEQAIINAPLPLLVDAGGIPSVETELIASACQGAILIADDPAKLAEWQELLHRAQAVPIAVLTSKLEGSQTIHEENGILSGIISGLGRDVSSDGICFDALLLKVAQRFQYTREEMFTIHKEHAGVDLVVHLERALYPLPAHVVEENWQPQELPALLASLPDNEPMALYGIGPNWVYAALAAYTLPPPIIFTTQSGWLHIPADISYGQTDDTPLVQWIVREGPDRIYVKGDIIGAYLDPEDREMITLPLLPEGNGVILAGRLPNWVYAMAARGYRNMDWVAVYQPQLAGAVVIWSQSPEHQIGEVLAVDHASFAEELPKM